MTAARERSPSSEPGPGAGRIDLSRAGRRVDLVVDGVPYSTFHPDKPWSGYVWDALAATGLLVEPREPSILLLGGGGGTVLLLLRRLLPDAVLTAVELDPRVIDLARERFDLDRVGAEIIIDDGLEFLAKTRRRFDLVLDDMYAPGPNGLRRPVPDERFHLARMVARLAPNGVAATNSTTDDDPPGLERRLRVAYRAVLSHVGELRPRLGYNVVIAGSQSPLRFDAYRARVAALGTVDAQGIGGVRTARL